MARDGNNIELKNNNEIKEYVKEVDWDCELKTWFRDKNIGAYESVMNAIDWFFENEEFGVILEEDCLPSLAFFDFCHQLLKKYMNDSRIWFISGSNYLNNYNPNGYDYCIVSAAYQWGWATWKNRWMKIERNGFNIKEMLSYKLNHQFYADKRIANYEDRKYKALQDKNGWWKPISWDYIFQLSMRINGGLAIIPTTNLVSNIGIIGLHNAKSNSRVHNVPVLKISSYKIENHPTYIVSDLKVVKRFYIEIVNIKRVKTYLSHLKHIMKKYIK